MNSRTTNSRKVLITMAVLAAVATWSDDAFARERKGPLVGEPIVRQKLQLRRFRFQLTPYVGMSLSQPFVHMGYVGAKATFHFADWMGARATFGYGVVPVASQLLRDINRGGLPQGVPPGQMTVGGSACPADYPVNCRSAAEADNPAPLLHDFRAGLVRAQWQSSVDAVFTPFAGKMGLFSGIFTEYDIYIFGGLGLVGYANHYDDQSTAEAFDLVTDPDSEDYCRYSETAVQNECTLHPVDADTGVKVGGSFGAGFNLFLTDWVALNLEFQDIIVSVNHTGLNSTLNDVPPIINSDDRDVFHNVTMQLGARFYFPFRAKRTE